ncbi:MAG: hypothetical protein KDA24_20315 [Deltaproteobacteria bacterium]|nr:hypothetical protein [Deltaproteobacteria bacterium]
MADPASIVPGLCGEPVAWLGWLALVTVVAARGASWRRAWAAASLASLPLVWAGLATGASPAALLVVVGGLVGSLCSVGALAGIIGGTRASRAAIGVSFGLVLVGIDFGAGALVGPAGGVLDGLAFGPGVGRAAHGELDITALVSVAAPGFWALAAIDFLTSRRAGRETTDARVRLGLIPLVALLVAATAPPLPPLLDGTTHGTASLHPTTEGALHRLDRPVMLSWATGGAPHQEQRASRRAFERIAGSLTRAALQPLTAQRLEGSGSELLLQEAGTASPEEPWTALEVRALDRAELLSPVPRAERLQEAVAQSLWRLGSPAEQQLIVSVGSVDGAQFGRPVQVGEASHVGEAAAVVVAPVSGGLNEAALRGLDAHVMKGGGLVVLYGEPVPDGPRAGVRLTNPWGFHAEGVIDEGVAEASEAWTTFSPLRVGPGTPRITGPNGLGEAVARAGGEAVAMAMIGSVPSGFAEPGAEPRQSNGSVRVFLTSAALVRANPGLLARALDWVLDEEDISALRSTRTPRPARPLPLLLVLALLPGVAALLTPGARQEVS